MSKVKISRNDLMDLVSIRKFLAVQKNMLTRYQGSVPVTVGGPSFHLRSAVARLDYSINALDAAICGLEAKSEVYSAEEDGSPAALKALLHTVTELPRG